MRVVVLGASGYIGGALYEQLRLSHVVVGTGRTRRPHPDLVALDLRDTGALRAIVRDADCVVNLAGVSDVVTAERDPALAEACNVTAVGVLVDAVRPEAKVIHVSTDNVFDGLATYYDEDSSPRPTSVYGATKLRGEARVLERAGNVVVRIPLVYGHGPWSNSFLRRFATPVVRAQTDVVCSPLYLGTLAEELERLMTLTGLVHLGGSEVMTRYVLMTAVRDALGLQTVVRPASEAELAGPVPRPPRLVLRSARQRWALPTFGQTLTDLATRWTTRRSRPPALDEDEERAP